MHHSAMIGTFVMSGKAHKPIAPKPRYDAVDHLDLTFSSVNFFQIAKRVNAQQTPSKIRVQVVLAWTKNGVNVPAMLG